MRTSRQQPAPPGAGWRAGVAAMVDLLGPLDQHVCSDRERIDAIDALRGLIAAAGAAQVRLTAAYAESQRALGASARGVAAEVGFAQRVGIAQAQRLVASAVTLVADLPETLELVSEGELSVERARVVAERVTDVEPEVRHIVDERICGEVDLLADRQVRDAVDAIVMQVDADHIEQCRLIAFQRRRVTLRPVGDGMAWLSILTTLVDAAQAEQTLRQHADRTLAEAAPAAASATAAGLAADEGGPARAASGAAAQADPGSPALSQGALMADAAIDRLTGRFDGVGPQVAIHLVMTPETLTGTGPGRDLPAHVLGVGPLPARAARDLLMVASAPAETVAATPHTAATPTTPDSAASATMGVSPASASSTAADADDRADDDVDSAVRLRLDDAEWGLDITRRDQRLAELERLDRQVERHSREASRVTVRRLFVDAGGRTFTGMDARVGMLPAPFRQRLGDPDGDHDGAMTAWLGLLQGPPKTEELVPLESMARLFIGLLRRFLQIRDKTCRAPWCGAPIRHLDHATPWVHGGATSAINGNGTCEGHNLAKESPGYRVTTTSALPARPHTVTWVTPTGRTVSNTAPPPLGWGTRPPARAEIHSPLERHLAALLSA